MIPNIAHFNYGLIEQKEDFLFVYYIAVLSCKVINNPDKIYFYYHYEPKGHWWEKTKELCELVFVPIPTHIGAKELKKTAHKSDILRIMKLNEIGGVYLDIDTICVKSYSHLLTNKFVIANEITESGKNMGLCNAIIMSEPGSSFIINWINNYETFFETDGWQEASTFLPAEIAKYDKSVTILKPENFLLPSWEQTDMIFEKSNQIPEDLIVLHYWNQYSHEKYLNAITNFDWIIDNAHTLYGKLLVNLLKHLTNNKNQINPKKEIKEIKKIYGFSVVSDNFNLNKDINLSSNQPEFQIETDKNKNFICVKIKNMNSDNYVEFVQEDKNIKVDNILNNKIYVFGNLDQYKSQIKNMEIKSKIEIDDIKIFITHKYVENSLVIFEIFRTDSNGGWDKELYLDIKINGNKYLCFVGKSLTSTKTVLVDFPENIEIENDYEQKIPKKIFQIYVHPLKLNEMDIEMANTIKIIQKFNPEYEYKLLTDFDAENFLNTFYSANVLEAYNTLNLGPFKADLLRYCLLYKEGGIYMDCKMTPIKPFRNIINPSDKCVLVNNTFEKGSKSIYNAFMCSEPNNPLFLNCIKQIVINCTNKFYPEDVFLVTGPSLVYKIYNEIKCDARLLSHPNIGLHYSDHNNGVFDESGELVIYKTYKTYYKNNNGANYVKQYYAGNCYNKNLIITYNTKYGLITLFKNELYIGEEFKKGNYWDEDTLLKLKEYIKSNRNILEIGGHCGTSSIVYSTFLNDDKKVFVYEPQKEMFNLLQKNIKQNKLENKIVPYNYGVFCYEGVGTMNSIDLDGDGGEVSKRYNEENNLGCNFGGIGLGKNGEQIKLTTIDSMNLEDIGFIHCDAQGSENFIFSKAINTIRKHRPIILYENYEFYGKYLYDNICNTYTNFKEESQFDIKKYCMEELKYSKFIDRFNGGIDTLLIP